MELFGMRRTVGDLKGMRGGASMDAAETNGVGPDDVKSYEVGRAPNNPPASPSPSSVFALIP